MNTIIKRIGIMVCLLAMISCQKEAFTPVNFDDYNQDTFVPGEIDEWITTTFTDTYNIEVLYRYNRAMHDIERNVSPPDESMIKPQMIAVLEGFLKVYENVAGATFIKTYTPKQFVLFGSPSFNANGSYNLGTADGGRRVVLYDVNRIDVNDPDDIKRKLRTIHHEFAHILNQNVLIPQDFEQVSKADYFADWTNSSNSEDVSRSMGFISRYARSQVGEDWAETIAHLLVEGQLWYDKYAADSGAEAKAKMKQKEAIVRNWFKQHFDIDFSQLQFEFDRVMRENYHNTVRTSLQYWIEEGAFAALTVDHRSTDYADYGISADFEELYNSVSASMADVSFPMNFVEVLFQNSEKVTFSVNFNQGTNTFLAYYDYDLILTEEETYRFEFSDPQGGTTGAYANANIASIRSAVTPFLDYLENNEFRVDWYPQPQTIASFNQYGRFTVVGQPESYFYGVLERR